MNKVILKGNLTRNPQLSYLPSGREVVNFAVAVNERWKDASGQPQERVTFVDCVSFGGIANVINQCFYKGKAILLEGKLKQDIWEDNGGKRQKLKIIVENFFFIDSGQSQPANQANPQYQQPANYNQQNRAAYSSGGKQAPAPLPAQPPMNYAANMYQNNQKVDIQNPPANGSANHTAGGQVSYQQNADDDIPF